jgi:hypothetical protein
MTPPPVCVTLAQSVATPTACASGTDMTVHVVTFGKVPPLSKSTKLNVLDPPCACPKLASTVTGEGLVLYIAPPLNKSELGAFCPPFTTNAAPLTGVKKLVVAIAGPANATSESAQTIIVDTNRFISFSFVGFSIDVRESLDGGNRKS